jgi:biotin operon repressor
MAAKHGYSEWTEREDHYVLSNRTRLTPAMMAEDLGRSLASVQSRIKTLRGKGIQIASVPAGRRSLAEAAKMTSDKWLTEPDVPLAVERETLRDEIAAYLKSQIEIRRLTIAQAFDLTEKLKYRVVHAPADQLRGYLTMRVDEIVKRAA